MTFPVRIAEGLFAGELLCPLCGGEYLHQGAVEIFHHRTEDAEPVVLAIVEGIASDASDIPNAGARNPSSRRQGLLIHFDCETCNLLQSGIVLAFSQHKGRTFVEWRNPVANGAGVNLVRDQHPEALA